MNPKLMHDATPNEDTLRLSAKSGEKQEKAPRATPLHPEDLVAPVTFRLKHAHRNNPALASLCTDNGQRLNRSTLTIATGAFLPGLLSPELRQWPLWVFCCPAFSDTDVEDLATVEDPAVFRNCIAKVYLVWQAGEYSVCVDESSVAESLEEASDTAGKLIVAFISEEVLSIRAIGIDDELFGGLQAASLCRGRDSEFTIGDSDEADLDWDDDVNFGDFRPADWMEGPQGEDAYRMEVRHLSDYAAFVPTRAVEVTTPNDFLAEAPRVSAALHRIAYGHVDFPVVIEARGRHLGVLVPEACADFPVLVFALPDFMGEDLDMRELTKSILMPCSAFGTDASPGEVQLHLNNRRHQLHLAVSQLEATMRLANYYRELILTFVGIDTVCLRYYALDDEWLALLSATAHCAHNKTGKDLWTPEECEAGGTKSTTMPLPHPETNDLKPLAVTLAKLEP